MIDEKRLIAKLENWVKESKEESGLKEPALLRKVMDEVKSMAVNEEIRQRIEREDTEEPKLIDTVDANAEMEELVDRQLAVSDRWIPVSKHLPENEDDVIVTVRGYGGRSVEVDHYDLDFESWEMFSDPGEVIAWMPLPEPYKGE